MYVEHIVATAAAGNADSDDRLDTAEGRQLLLSRHADSLELVREGLAGIGEFREIAQSRTALLLF